MADSVANACLRERKHGTQLPPLGQLKMKGAIMAEHTCHNCVYSLCDPCQWLRNLRLGEPILPRCANHPQWPGRIHDVPGVPCRNYRPRSPMPEGDVRLIPLGDGHYAYVDAADYEWLSRWKWHLCGCGYAGRNEKGKTILMHRQIMQPPKGRLVDHSDGTKANNCRSNLRVCNHAENQRNMRKQHGAVSRFKGVFFDKRCAKWYAKCRHEGRHRGLGYFDNEVDAARAYDRAAVVWFGEFARLNFPNEWPPERRQELYALHVKEQQSHKEARRDRPRRVPQSAFRNPKSAIKKVAAETERRKMTTKKRRKGRRRTRRGE